MSKGGIVIYGTGATALKFVLTNKNIEICSFVEGKNKKKKVFMKDLFPFVPVLLFEEAEVILKKHYTVVASSEDIYWEIKNRLEKEYGLIEFENFEYWETYQKKIAVIYGNCHTVPIKEALKLSKKFNDNYGFYPLKAVQNMKANGGEGINSEVYGRCDLFIHQCIWEKNVYGPEYASGNFMKQLPSACTVIGIPNLYRMPKFMFPQISDNENPIQWEDYNYFPFRDKYIDQYYDSMSIPQIESMILDDNLISPGKILVEKEKFYEKVKEREKEWDIKVLGFLRSAMKDERLFYDPNHPSGFVIGYMINKIFELLGISDVRLDHCNIAPMDTYEIPIYRSVSKALGFQYHTEYLRVFHGHKLNSNQMDLREYISQYIAWNYPE
ncbi:MAG: hypothetical protein HFG58_01670 [Lachnospiraceae bacterium]|nr:hypothetical protein [Lachnospiraceae bacterium]